MVREHIHTDGRVARGERTRQKIVAAHRDLLRAGELKPTAQKIAEQAGVSVRTLWANFHDLEGLLAETTQDWLDTDADLRTAISPQGPLPERIDAFCAERVRRLENIAPAARAAALGEPFSPALQASRAAHIERITTDTQYTFAPELERAGAQRLEVLHGLVMVVAWHAWDILRSDVGLAPDDATAVMRRVVSGLLDHL